MALYNSYLRTYPLIVVLGATGTGKSKLALEVASQFNGEIINADSMQIYKGLDIITNKVTQEEQNSVKHHLLGFVDPLSNFTVHDFKKRALPILDELSANGKLPVIVGGTHYYIEAVLWDFLLSSKAETDQNKGTCSSDSELSGSDSDAPDEQQLKTVQDVLSQPITQRSLDKISGAKLHQFLKDIDPERADSLHPNNRRKIIRSLQVYQQTGLPHSYHLSKQHEVSGGCSVSGPLMFPNAHIFWVQCEQTVLKDRLDARVNDMVSAGLLQEMIDFHKDYNKKRIESKKLEDYTQGIFQSIGFKEFHKYLVMPEEARQTAEGQQILEECINSMKTVTRQYSKRQVKWINGRFVKKANRQIPPLYGFDASNVAEWNSNVRAPAFRTVEDILMGKTTENHRISVENSIQHVNKTFHCDVCSKPIVGSLQWQAHLQSRSHYKVKKKKNARMENSKNTLRKREESACDSADLYSKRGCS